MPTRPIDERFAHFCRTGDPGALGEVFDATAPELLHVALWLSGNRNDAEDLLQRTFLLAIETRARFERGRPAVPWLLGVLSREMRRLRRERTRRAPSVPPLSNGPDPEAAAATAELTAAVRNVRAKMSEPYRDVLQLHLEQGLNAKEIGARLGRPAGTVRTQLMRALELLRRRLPSGFATGLVLFVPEPAVPATVKATVVAAAKRAAPLTAGTAAATAIVSGGMLMSTKVLLTMFAALLLLALGVYGGWLGAPAAATPVAASAAQSNAPGEAALATTAPAPPERRPLPTPAAGNPGFASLRVVVRWQDDGSPAASVGISARKPDYSAHMDGVTGADGSCVLPHLAPASWQLTCTHALTAQALVLAADEHRTIELTAVRQATLSGRVVDTADRPVAGASVWVADGMGPDERQYELARTDAGGSFALPVTGMLLVGARKSGQASSLARRVDAAAGDQRIELQLRGAGATVRGTVRAPDAKPLAWARVEVGATMQLSGVEGPFENATEPFGEQQLTGADGAFVFVAVKPAGVCVRVWAAGCAPHCASLSVLPDQVLTIDVQLRPGAVVAGDVRRQDGRPVTGAIVQVVASAVDYWHAHPVAHTDASGHFELRDLPCGELEFEVRADGCAVRHELQLVAGATTPWNPILPIGRNIRGRVLGPDGAPLADVQLGTMPERDVQPRRLVTTDAAGAFTIDAGDEPVIVRVGDLQHEPLQTIADVQPGTDQLEIRINHADLPTACIRGRVADAGGGPVEANIEVRNQRGIHWIRDVKTDATGAFELGPMRPGRRELLIRTRHFGWVPVEPLELGPDETRDLGTITVAPPGSATITVAAKGGEPPAGGHVSVGSRDGRVQVAWTAVTDGRAAIAALPPGRWWVVTDTGAMPAELVIVSGETTHLEMRPRQF